MAILVDTRTGPIVQADGAGDQPLRQGRQGALVVSDGHARYYEAASRRASFNARAVVTAPVIYTTAAGTGGPLLWNPSTSNINAVITAIGCAVTVVTTVAAALGITGNSGQTSAPTSTTAIDSTGNNYIGGPASACTAYRVGTPTNAGAWLLPLLHLHTGALTVDTFGLAWVELAGQVIVPPGCWASVAASATATTTVAQIGMVWEEIPV